MADHALLSASAAHRWGNCPGSLAMEAGQENKSSGYADEGTAAHELAAWCLNARNLGVTSPHEFPHSEIKIGGDLLHPVDEDMCNFVQTYVDQINAAAEGGTLLVEQRVDYSNAIGVPGQFGTSDAIIVKGDTLEIRDLKYGMGNKVEAEDNEQMQLYALGALALIEMLDLADDIKQIRLGIHQPRLFAVSEWVITREQLEAFRVEYAEKARDAFNYYTAGRAEVQMMFAGGSNVLQPSEDACRWCKAKSFCPALRSFVLSTVSDDFVDVSQDIAPQLASAEERIANADNLHVSNCLKAVDLIESWCTAVRARAESELLKGHDVPGFKLVQGRKGSRSWLDEADAEKMLKSMRLKQDEMYSFKLISPTVAEKVLKETPKRWNKLQALITRSDGKPSVAPVSDKRDALVIEPVADAFTDISGEDLA